MMKLSLESGPTCALFSGGRLSVEEEMDTHSSSRRLMRKSWSFKLELLSFLLGSS